MRELLGNAAHSLWLSLHLPRLKTDRLLRCGRAPADHPLAVYAKQANAFVLTGVCAHAAKLGLHAGQALADARAIYPELIVFEGAPEEDARVLDAIAAWCERFTPVVVRDAPDGLFLDIAGCAHLFGGEAAMRADILARLQAQGFAARAAIAETPGAAWALARYGREEPLLPCGEGAGVMMRASVAKLERGASGDACAIGDRALQLSNIHASPRPLAPSPSRGGGIERLLSALPIEALRLDENAAALLRRLGLKTIGQLIEAPRANFTARAGQAAMRRLDQALGRAPEALSPRRPPPPMYALRRFLEPLFTLDAVLEATQTLCGDAIAKLDVRGLGARACALHLFGVDGRDRAIAIGASRPSRDVKALMRLFREKIERAGETLDMEFGIEAARLDVTRVERMDGETRALVASETRSASAEQVAALVDVLAARLGEKRVLRPVLRDAHAPERAGGWASMGEVSPKATEGVRAQAVKAQPQEAMLERSAGLTPSVSAHALTAPPSRGSVRPLTLFSRAQPIEALATVPDGPPIRFRWRRVLRDVARAEGPERIAGDWLKGEAARDFYRVEDSQGRRYWLYREGAYGETAAPRWFVAGLG